MTRALVPLADGCEEMEAVIIIDTLRRARWDVLSVGTMGETVTASRGVVLVPDAAWDDIVPEDFDALVLPGGGEGTANLKRDERILATVRRFVEQGKLTAAICAGPLVLQEAGVLHGRSATCHPGVADAFAGERSDARVVVDGHVVTSQGPGTAFEFALSLIRLVDGDSAADAVQGGLILPTH